MTQARTLLLRLKEGRTSPLTFIPDEHDVSHLPGWVRAPKRITDGHLSKLATANGAVLATLNENIPGRIWFRNSVVFGGWYSGVALKSSAPGYKCEDSNRRWAA